MTAQQDTLTLFLFVDALGWELLQKHSFLDDALPYRRPLDTVFGYSSTCDPTILTGKAPRDHGHFSFFCYNPSESPFRLLRPLGWLPKTITSRGRVRHWISRLVKPLLGYTGYFQLYNVPFHVLPLFEYTEKRDLYQPGGINAGCSTIFDHLRDRRAPFFLSDWRRPEQENLAALDAALTKGEISFAYLYMAALDAILHREGTTGAGVQRHMAWYDAQIRRLLARAQARYTTVRLYLFSDHGMTDVTTVCDLMARIDALGLRFGHDYAAMYDSTMARFWFLNDAARTRIVRALEAEPLGHVLSDDELQRFGCDFPNTRYGDLFFLLKPGVLLCPSFMGQKPLAAMHGYDPGDQDSVAAFLSNVTPDPAPQGLADIYALMLSEAQR